ncbi:MULTISPECIES: DUF1993 domain-containing protein [unclassified Sphingomonas]|uniref:DUF1993 domain-containing protein n=1 Tax=unclassified Sphingomonas TaxID=196159 RepID=UPI0009268720|nr:MULTISPECIES: DUF1993 domain-containing protein [unclassified Sphingomonas]OJU16956.1 MAG: hypothetical protein BGN95_06880 [Sphingomonas sp. 66-10]
MTFSLYDAVIPSNLQILGAVAGLIDKAEAFAAEKHITPEAMIDARLAPDMLPFGYQVKSSVDHSAGAVAGVRAGSFSPNLSPWSTDFAGLRAMVQEGIDALKALDPAEFDALAARDCEFRMGDLKLPFGGATFLLSFSQPNFYFHATTAYDVLRAKGVKLGKRDFLGQLRVKL